MGFDKEKKVGHRAHRGLREEQETSLKERKDVSDFLSELCDLCGNKLFWEGE
jgi:hypothetical protein